MVPSAETLPATVKRTYKVNDIPTDVVVQLFADRTLVCISQVQYFLTYRRLHVCLMHQTHNEGAWRSTQVFNFCFWLFSLRMQLSGRVGTFLNCSMEFSIIDGSRTYNVSPLLGGSDDPRLEVYARNITERIITKQTPANSLETSSTTPGVVLLGISLKKRDKKHENEQSTFRALMDIVSEMYDEARHQIMSR
jgi:hypothetical protein